MPLSEEELRLLEQMERALVEEDPKFASTLRGTTLRSAARRRAILAGVCFVLGIVVLMTGAIAELPPIGIAGFVIMLASATFGLAALRGQNAAQGQATAPPSAPAATARPGSRSSTAGGRTRRPRRHLHPPSWSAWKSAGVAAATRAASEPPDSRPVLGADPLTPTWSTTPPWRAVISRRTPPRDRGACRETTDAGHHRARPRGPVAWRRRAARPARSPARPAAAGAVVRVGAGVAEALDGEHDQVERGHRVGGDLGSVLGTFRGVVVQGGAEVVDQLVAGLPRGAVRGPGHPQVDRGVAQLQPGRLRTGAEPRAGPAAAYALGEQQERHHGEPAGEATAAPATTGWRRPRRRPPRRGTDSLGDALSLVAAVGQLVVLPGHRPERPSSTGLGTRSVV